MTVVTWADSPATTTPLDAAELNAAFAGCMQADGTVTATASQKTSVTLGGANKEVMRWTATDGSVFALYIRVTGTLAVYDVTHAIWCFEIETSGAGILVNGVAVPTVGAHNAVSYTLSAGSGAPATLATNEIFFQLS